MRLSVVLNKILLIVLTSIVCAGCLQLGASFFEAILVGIMVRMIFNILLK